jgi:hypothetical protein
MANYPAADPSFTPIVDGVDYPQAADLNVVYDEVTAIGAALRGGLEHDLFPESTGDARTLGASNKFWGQAYVKGLTLGAASELTIATGAVMATPGIFTVDTESDAAADDLATVTAGSGVVAGSIVILRAENVARVVTLKDGTGNLLLDGDYALSATDRQIALLYDGTNWRELARSVGFQVTAQHVQVRNEGTQTITANTDTAITFGAEDLDTNGFHSTSADTSRLTCPTGGDGTYEVWARIPFLTASAADTVVRVKIKKGGTEIAVMALTATQLVRYEACIQHYVALAATEYVEVTVQEVNNNTNLTVGSATAAFAARFGMKRIA